MAESPRMKGAPDDAARPYYDFEHLPEDFKAGGGHAWGRFERIAGPLFGLFVDGERRNCYLVEMKTNLVESKLGGRSARAIYIEGDFGVSSTGDVFSEAWLVEWENCALFVMGDKQFKELYEPVGESTVDHIDQGYDFEATPQMGGENPATTSDPLVAFFYVLLRQMASPGDVEQQVHAMESAPSPPVGADREWTLTNAYLHGYAENLTSRLYALRASGPTSLGLAPDQTLIDLYRQMLLLRRFQLFPVEWVTLHEAQKWMGVTEHEAEAALEAMTEREVLVVHSVPRPGESWPNEQRRWTLSTEQRSNAIEKPPVPKLPVDAVEEREKRYEMEERIGAVVAACRRFEAQREPAAQTGLPNDIARAQGEIQAAAYFRELIGEKLPPPSED